MPNPPFANPGVAERASWRSTKRGVAGVRSILEMPTDSCHFPCASDTLVRPQHSLAQKALSATRGLARGGLGTHQVVVNSLQVVNSLRVLFLESLSRLSRRYVGVVLPHLPVGGKFVRFCLAWPA